MFDFESLKAAKATRQKQDEGNSKQFDTLLNDALITMKEFFAKKETGSLKLAAEKFEKCIQYKKTEAEPYAYLAYIFFLLNETNLSLKYIKAAEFLEPGSPVVKKMVGLLKK